ncbi:hypothetical protein ACFQQB_43120 [Nonomuraea rubra]|uniref:hypothetical protein n=1 Tax=Nonomuraea rubra TaxID=46180 RepID=UPI0036135161
MSVAPPPSALSPDPNDDPAATLEAAAWALAALIATLDDAATKPLADVLAADPQRTAVLEAAGLVQRDGDTLVLHPSYRYPDGPTNRSAAQARLSSLRQAVAAAAGTKGRLAAGRTRTTRCCSTRAARPRAPAAPSPARSSPPCPASRTGWTDRAAASWTSAPASRLWH